MVVDQKGLSNFLVKETDFYTAGESPKFIFWRPAEEGWSSEKNFWVESCFGTMDDG